MTMYETSDLLKRVERYEAAVEELRAAHQDVRTFLVDQVIYERWQQLGAELGFVAGPARSEGAPQQAGGTSHDLHSLNQQIPQLSESWAG
jgi:hypothetical protein